jgi:hypothetical protein
VVKGCSSLQNITGSAEDGKIFKSHTKKMAELMLSLSLVKFSHDIRLKAAEDVTTNCRLAEV